MLARLSNWVPIVLAGLAYGHQVAWHDAMWCRNGTTPGVDDPNTNHATKPIWRLTFDEYWLHKFSGCDQFPPAPGVFMDIPSGGKFVSEIADNRRHTTLDGPGAVLTDWGDGMEHPDDYNEYPGCITQPNLHTWNESTSAGTAWAITYESDPYKVKPADFVVFTVRYRTPFKRVVEYDVPCGMPECPPEGCLCLWLWSPYQCGEPNIYIFPYRCKIIPDGTQPRTIGKPKPPTYCEGDPSQCACGPKQPIVWNQAEGEDNIHVEGYDSNGLGKTPGYNQKCGFRDGAQLDIFADNSTTGCPPFVSCTSGSPASKAGTAASATPVLGTPSSTVAPSSTGALPSSGIPSSPSAVPAPAPSGSTCQLPTPASHSKRMKSRRAGHNIF